MQRLHDQCVVMLSQDSFYRGLSDEEKSTIHKFNFDHPDAFDTPLLMSCLKDLQDGKAIDVPIYDFTTHSRSGKVRRVEPADVIIIEGILVLHEQSVRNLCNMKVFVDTDDDLRLARRIQRDVADRGRDVEGVINQYTKFVKPSFDQFIAPSRRYADVIIPWAKGTNHVAIELITEHIRLKLQQPVLARLFSNLAIIPSNFQIQSMLTMIRDRSTPKNEFVFYADRLNRLVVEAGLGHLPFTERVVQTPTGHPYAGVGFARKLCGVSVIRSGEAMESALRDCCKGIKIGKILIHQQVAYKKLPMDIAERHVLLLNPLISTGHTIVRAIEILKEHGVSEERILVLSIMCSPEAVRMVCGGFPLARLVVAEVDSHVNDQDQLVPGCGNYGDRYFCE
nr:uridine kinase (UK) [Polytomella parva]|eukprot:CAMPEP_0175050432 /NCGR_PEP_ID=MMETSP0052_2-20121109/7257_1 /TAXON_ID=51329 ORGANISM="Polytomella parva, Strain SAG 63-3" /NCGR_SAMPLE_ID=MMETSP0052_2 /ASSEMBLY_ACC=CAM_ASM_000194 /LENGTH=393 /DNA_ID=CAMNT_0016314637 /DNA_START=457 /DNA_END=1638 /DNA_ORIENTATION=+